MASAQDDALCKTFEAGENLSAKQFFAVKLNSSGQVVLAGAGERVIGILQNKPESGAAAKVATVRGTTSKLKFGGSVTAGDAIKADSAGKGASGTGNLDKAFAICLFTAVDGDINEVLLADIYVAAS